jgi:hypothetical protein
MYYENVNINLPSFRSVMKLSDFRLKRSLGREKAKSVEK